MSGEEKSIRILTFSGKKKDWNMWSEKFLAKASMRGYDEILDGTTKVEKDSVTTVTKEQEVARQLNKKAYNELVLSAVDSVTSGIIKSAKRTGIKKGDAKDAWDKLKTKYEPNTGQELLDLDLEYTTKVVRTPKTSLQSYQS